MVEHINVANQDIRETLRLGRITVSADLYGVCNVWEEHAVADSDVLRMTAVIPAVAINGDRIVRVAQEAVLNEDIRGTEEVDAVAVAGGREGAVVVDMDAVCFACGQAECACRQ